jgi:hypothetical protein
VSHPLRRNGGCIVNALADPLLHFFEPGSGTRTMNYSSQEFQPLGDIVPIAPDVIFCRFRVDGQEGFHAPGLREYGFAKAASATASQPLAKTGHQMCRTALLW